MSIRPTSLIMQADPKQLNVEELIMQADLCERMIMNFKDHLAKFQEALDNKNNFNMNYVLNKNIKTDGKGMWSRKVKDVFVTRARLAPEDSSCMIVYFDLSTWDIDTDGLIYTDQSFIDTLNTELYKVGFMGIVDYSENGMQGKNYVHLDIIGIKG